MHVKKTMEKQVQRSSTGSLVFKHFQMQKKKKKKTFSKYSKIWLGGKQLRKLQQSKVGVSKLWPMSQFSFLFL